MSKSNVPRGTCAVEKYLYFYFPGNNYNIKKISFFVPLVMFHVEHKCI